MFFFFFKQKTAYEMRISDWSSDVCSSDLHRADQQLLDVAAELGAEEARRDVAVAVLDHAHHHQPRDDEVHVPDPVHLAHARADQAAEDQEVQGHGDRRRRSEEHTSELQSLMRLSYAVFCLKQQTNNT